MDQHPVNGSLPSGKERVRLENSSKIGYRGFVVFLICCGLLLAAFAVSSVWLRGDDGLFHDWGSFPGGETGNSDGSDLEEPSLNVETPREELSVADEERRDLTIQRLWNAYQSEDTQAYNSTAYKVILAMSDIDTHMAPFRDTQNPSLYMNRVLQGMVLTTGVAKYIAQTRGVIPKY